MLLRGFLLEGSSDIQETLMDALEEFAPVKFVGLCITEESAKTWLTEHPLHWDIAIVDLRLLEGVGFGLLETCKQRSSMQKIIVLSGSIDDDIMARCNELGADGVFDKTRDMDRLVDFCKIHSTYLAFMLETGLVSAVDLGRAFS